MLVMFSSTRRGVLLHSALSRMHTQTWGQVLTPPTFVSVNASSLPHGTCTPHWHGCITFPVLSLFFHRLHIFRTDPPSLKNRDCLAVTNLHHLYFAEESTAFHSTAQLQSQHILITCPIPLLCHSIVAVSSYNTVKELALSQTH